MTINDINSSSPFYNPHSPHSYFSVPGRTDHAPCSASPLVLFAVMYGALKTVDDDDDPSTGSNNGREEGVAVTEEINETMDDVADEQIFVAAGSTDAIVESPQHRRADGGAERSRRGLFRSVRFYVICQGLIQLSYLILGSYLKSVITSIEKRFGLDSKTAGFMSSGFEIGNLIVILPVSYFGRRIHRPRAIAVGVWFMIAGGLLLATPHWIYGPYVPPGGSGGGGSGPKNFSHDLCHVNATSSFHDVPLVHETPSIETSQSGIWRLMFFARILVGIGAAPVQPYGEGRCLRS